MQSPVCCSVCSDFRSVYVRIVSCLLTHSHLRQEATQRHPFIHSSHAGKTSLTSVFHSFFFFLAHPSNSWWLVLRIIFYFCGRGRTECNLSPYWLRLWPSTARKAQPGMNSCSLLGSHQQAFLKIDINMGEFFPGAN